MRVLASLLAVLALAGCGSSGSKPHGTTLYEAGDWSVRLDGTTATAYHRVDGEWRAVHGRGVAIAILGPKRGQKASATPQVAVELTSTRRLVESGLWVDGQELLVKGGGLTTSRTTIYGAPAAPLAPGRHTAVAYGRTDTTAAAVAWTFRV